MTVTLTNEQRLILIEILNVPLKANVHRSKQIIQEQENRLASQLTPYVDMSVLREHLNESDRLVDELIYVMLRVFTISEVLSQLDPPKNDVDWLTESQV